MAALITRERATRNIAQTSFSAEDELVIDTQIAAVSTAVESYCQRRFQLQQYDELYNGNMQRRLVLRNYPIKSIDRIAYAPTPAIQVRNTDSTTNQRARLEVTDTALNLQRVASGTTYRNQFLFSAYPTLQSICTGILALGNGWTIASVLNPTFANLSSDEMRQSQGNYDCLTTTAQPRVYQQELNDFEVDAPRGWVLRSRSMEGYPYPPGSPYGITWFGGWNYWRVIYTAGFDQVPDDVQEAVAQWAAAWFWQTKRDPGLYHDILHGVYTHVPFVGMPQNVQVLLAPYKTRKLLSLGS
jgi:hypothetical protein